MRSFLDEYPLNSGRLTAAPVFADHVETVVLRAAELVRVAVPVGARLAFFSLDGEIRVKPAEHDDDRSTGRDDVNGSGAELATTGSVSFYA